MRTLLLAAALALSTGACSKASSTAPAPAPVEHAAIPTVTPDQLDQALAQGQARAVDANGQPTRERMGVVPGALLLSDGPAYQLSELPPDKAKPLVFYCANTACGASRLAAERAVAGGYTHVQVMPQGIAGWVKAGKKVQQI